MKIPVFVDGQAGTTGLEIHQRLRERPDIEILEVEDAKRKDTAERERLLNAADIVFLCLPDVAARESVGLVRNEKTRIIDASTAHRIDPDWTYGIPELTVNQRQKIRTAKRVAVPGCWASGFVMALRPLVDAGIVPSSYPLSCFGVSGYSGGGRKMIEEYEGARAEGNTFVYESPRFYALDQRHKHLPEMRVHAGLDFEPLFSPIVSNIYRGMIVATPLLPRMLPGKQGPEAIHDALARHYEGQTFVKVMPYEEKATIDDGYLHSRACDGTNRIEIFVFGRADQVLVASRLDNLGKGASGAAVQCMNLMIGAEESMGLKA